MDNSDQPTFQIPTSIPRRTLGQHNPGTSPVKSLSAHTSPRVTPTKGANPYGDRYIPLRQPHAEWNARFCAINNPDMEVPFKKPMTTSTTGSGRNQQTTQQSSSSSANAVATSSSSHSQDYYATSGSGNTTPTGNVQHACFDDARRDEMVVRALLRNEMLKERIDDVKLQILPSDEQLSSYSSSPIVHSPFQSTSGIFPHLERNAYGGSMESLVLPPTGIDDTTRAGAISPTMDMQDNRLRGGGGNGGTNNNGNTNGAATPTHGSTCGESPRPVNIPLSPVSQMHASPARSLFTYSAKTTPNKYGPPSTSVNHSPFNGPLGEDSQRLLRTPRKPQRKVPKNPYKVLDAPELQDDFYLNLVDWSTQNQLAVGLSSCVYLWSATTSQVTKLCDLMGEQDNVTAVQWADKGDLLAVGTNRGVTQIWDATTLKKIRDLQGHTSRIGCLAWNGDTICSGSRDRTILHRDIRCDDRELPRKLTNHRQEVCGLKWSPDKQLLASGGNDNQLLVWNLRRPEPVQTYTQHNAAVKALAWSPHHHGVLVSGGGTADRCLRFWNTLTGQPMQCIDTGSQVCNVAWSKHSSELVSTHGYSFNHVIIWKYPSLQPVTKLVGHQYRVLYLAMSPDGESIVTGAGDETLRFWHVFNKTNTPKIARSKLNLLSSLR
ncbi:unnamed protein product [Caenorhabditis angaria]|uniref:Fizzy-related protein homolog n=1 Tax=Caenorhabditis angaria TaxID=860376 RepID=A0A9P1ICS9_9PELO|nr:unnamed protein product [Caenorhabditis angaria]